MTELIEAVLITVIMVVCHEAGHYWIARKQGYKPTVGFTLKMGMQSGFLVSYKGSVEAATPQDLLRICQEHLAFNMGGIFGIIPVILWAAIFNRGEAGLFAVLFLTLYSLWEVSTSFDRSEFKFSGAWAESSPSALKGEDKE